MEEYISIRRIRKAFMKGELFYGKMYDNPKNLREKKVAMIALNVLRKAKKDILSSSDEHNFW